MVNKRMDGVDRRMLNGASGHFISSHGFCQGRLERVCVYLLEQQQYHQETDVFTHLY